MNKTIIIALCLFLNILCFPAVGVCIVSDIQGRVQSTYVLREADGFNLINVINPSDNSFQQFFQAPEDLATPLWMGRLNYSVPNLGPMDNFGVELIAVPDIKPTIFAPLGGSDGMVNFDAPYSFSFSGYKGMGIQALKEDVADDNIDNMEYGFRKSLSGTAGP